VAAVWRRRSAGFQACCSAGFQTCKGFALHQSIESNVGARQRGLDRHNKSPPLIFMQRERSRSIARWTHCVSPLTVEAKTAWERTRANRAVRLMPRAPLAGLETCATAGLEACATRSRQLHDAIESRPTNYGDISIDLVKLEPVLRRPDDAPRERQNGWCAGGGVLPAGNDFHGGQSVTNQCRERKSECADWGYLRLSAESRYVIA